MSFVNNGEDIDGMGGYPGNLSREDPDTVLGASISLSWQVSIWWSACWASDGKRWDLDFQQVAVGVGGGSSFILCQETAVVETCWQSKVGARERCGRVCQAGFLKLHRCQEERSSSVSEIYEKDAG